MAVAAEFIYTHKTANFSFQHACALDVTVSYRDNLSMHHPIEYNVTLWLISFQQQLFQHKHSQLTP